MSNTEKIRQTFEEYMTKKEYPYNFLKLDGKYVSNILQSLWTIYEAGYLAGMLDKE